MGVHGLRTRWGNYLTCTFRICNKDNWKAQSRKVAIAPSQQICQIFNFHILFEHHRIIDLTKQLFPPFSSIFCQYSFKRVSGGRTDVRSPSRSGYPPVQAKDGPRCDVIRNRRGVCLIETWISFKRTCHVFQPLIAYLKIILKYWISQ